MVLHPESHKADDAIAQVSSPLGQRENQNPWLGGRGARLTAAQKRRIRNYCLKRDRNQCMICSREADGNI